MGYAFYWPRLCKYTYGLQNAVLMSLLLFFFVLVCCVHCFFTFNRYFIVVCCCRHIMQFDMHLNRPSYWVFSCFIIISVCESLFEFFDGGFCTTQSFLFYLLLFLILLFFLYHLLWYAYVCVCVYMYLCI